MLPAPNSAVARLRSTVSPSTSRSNATCLAGFARSSPPTFTSVRLSVPSAETPPELPKPEPTENRDPFKSQTTGTAAAGGPADPVPGPQVDLRFVGFTEGQGQGAIATLRRGERRYFVRTGDTVRGYTVTSIEQNRVVLTGAGGQAVLLLREPEEEE